MPFPGHRRGTSGHVMAVFDGLPNALDVEIRGLEMICVSSRKIVQSARCLLQSRFFSLPPPPTEIGRTMTRRFLPLPPPLSWTLHRSVCWDGWMEKRLLRSLKPLLARRKESDNSPKPSNKKSKSSNKPRSDELRDLDE